MKKNHVNSKIYTITLVLLLTLSALIIALPTANAQDEPIHTTAFAFINAMPNVVGVNQQVLIHFGIHLPTLWPQLGWTDLSVEVERPDGSTYSIDGLTTDLTGGAGVNLTPDQVGTWHIRTIFPSQVVESPTRGFPVGTIVDAAVSDWFDITVTQEPAMEYPGVQLPSEYWSRPINAQWWSWSEVTGNTLGRERQTGEAPADQPIRPGNALAPETAHILWAEPILGGAFSALGGGLSSVETGIHATEDGDAYEGFFTPPVVLNGVLYLNKYKADGGSLVDQVVVAADIRTGEVLWEHPLLAPDGRSLRLTFGQSFMFDGFNYHGVFQYLICTSGSTWYFFEPTEGRLVMTYVNVPGGGNAERMYGPNGEIIIFTIDLEAGTLQKWNSAWVLEAAKWVQTPNGPDSTFGSWYRRFMGTTLDARLGIEWVADMPSRADLPDTTRTQNYQRIRYLGNDVTILGCNFDRGSPTGDPVTMWAITFDGRFDPTGAWQNLQWVTTSYSEEVGVTSSNFPDYLGMVPQKIYNVNAKLAWVKTWEAPMPYANLNIEDANMEDDVFTVAFNDNPTDWGFRLSTGEELWGPKGPWHYQTNWSYESSNSWNVLVGGYNIYLIGGHGGTIHALNSQTGESLWNYTLTDVYNTYLFNNAWRFRIDIITDGKVYLSHTEHSPFDPKPPEAPYVCLNLTTGEKIWEVSSLLRQSEWAGLSVIGDSIITAMNTYDQLVYAVGMGPSETKVAIQDNVVALGDQVLVTGTVMDISAGTKEERIAARFPLGVPAVSDDSMSPFMEYVYAQKDWPLDTIGVPVKIQIYDPNGEYAWIGTTTSDANGNFAYSFVPEMEGMYAVVATFDTTKGYWGSESTAYLQVGPAPSPGGPITPETPETPLITTEVAIVLVAAIAAIVIVAFLVLRRRK